MVDHPTGPGGADGHHGERRRGERTGLLVPDVIGGTRGGEPRFVGRTRPGLPLRRRIELVGRDHVGRTGGRTRAADNHGPSPPLLAAPATAPAANPAAAPAPAPPVRIELPSLGVDTDVIPVGVDDSGAMEVPDDVSEVGWYKFGPAPGAAAGSAVLTGHVDDYRQGVGVFGRIGDLTPGDVVRVSDQAGVSREFSVVSREEWAKGEVPLDRLFDRGGASRMVLITCGGSFNDSTLGYDDNIAITAVPIAS